MSKEPRVVSELSGGSRGWPFAGSVADLNAIGFRQTEYLIEGTAQRFRSVGPLSFDGRWSVEPDGEEPYRTRMLVTAPVEPSHSNGTLLVEWNNVSAGFDTIICDSGDLLSEGFTHVGITAQHLGAHGFDDAPQGLIAWDPQRYGTLVVPGDSYSYDIFTQGGRLAATVEPLQALPIARTVAVGVSQSAGRVATYFNAIQPREKFYDAFLLVGYFGAGSSIEDDEVVDLRKLAGMKRIRAVGQLFRDDLPVPMLVVNSEAEVLPSVPVRQPDTDHYRLWEIAGTPHTPPDMLGFMAKVTRDQIPMPKTEPTPDVPPQCQTTWWPAFLASMEHFQRWIKGGAPPPPQPRVAVVGDPPTIERDELGIAVGGVRLPEVDVPLASHQGGVDLPGTAALNGVSLPFPDGMLEKLYPDRATYLARFDAAAARSVQAQTLRLGDVPLLRRRAEEVNL
ncbi:MAG: signal peptide-containing protein [Acidimicrobiia bacterium]|nr:signal peptide-containing protein [Acidimicrobiia bacterium]